MYVSVFQTIVFVEVCRLLPTADQTDNIVLRIIKPLPRIPGPHQQLVLVLVRVFIYLMYLFIYMCWSACESLQAGPSYDDVIDVSIPAVLN